MTNGARARAAAWIAPSAPKSSSDSSTTAARCPASADTVAAPTAPAGVIPSIAWTTTSLASFSTSRSNARSAPA